MKPIGGFNIASAQVRVEACALPEHISLHSWPAALGGGALEPPVVAQVAFLFQSPLGICPQNPQPSCTNMEHPLKVLSPWC